MSIFVRSVQLIEGANTESKDFFSPKISMSPSRMEVWETWWSSFDQMFHINRNDVINRRDTRMLLKMKLREGEKVVSLLIIKIRFLHSSSGEENDLNDEKRKSRIWAKLDETECEIKRRMTLTLLNWMAKDFSCFPKRKNWNGTEDICWTWTRTRCLAN